jgi:hypothetical protein
MSGWEGRFDRTKAPSEPTGDCSEKEGDETQQCGTRHRLSRCVGGLRGLLLSLIYGLPILLLVLLNLRASILDGHVLRVSYRLGGAVARACCGSPVTAARMAAMAASRNAVGSFPGIALRSAWSIDENGSVVCEMLGPATCAAVCAVELTALVTPPSTFVMLR